ncbi:MAG: hypothetical protein V1801_00365 [Candidatus Falkowbacteria bacterium]
MEGKNFEINSQGLIANDLEKVKKEELKIIEYVKTMRSLLINLEGEKMEVYDKFAEISHELEKKYPDFRRTYLFHIMSYSSGINREECPRFDFPGEDSIVKRLEVLVKEYQIEAK